MTEPTIICPNCNTEIKLNESLAAPLIAAPGQTSENPNRAVAPAGPNKRIFLDNLLN